MRSFIVGCLTLLVMSGCSATVSDDTVTLLPLPREVVWNKGVFDSRSVSLSGDFSVTGAVREWLEESGIESSGTASAVVEVALVDRIDKAAVNQDEAYRLIVAPKSIRVEAVSENGVFWAVQTLRQLDERQGPGVRIPCCVITDWPAFKIRGFMHDTGRSFISPEELKHEIEILSRYKINTFHWHLTENQA